MWSQRRRGTSLMLPQDETEESIDRLGEVWRMASCVVEGGRDMDRNGRPNRPADRRNTARHAGTTLSWPPGCGAHLFELNLASQNPGHQRCGKQLAVTSVCRDEESGETA